MIRPFGLRDIWAVKRLQPHGVALDLERQIISSSWPLLEALSGHVTRNHLGSRTFVYQEEGLSFKAFAQIRETNRQRTWDLFYLAPKPSLQDDEALWIDLFRQLLKTAARAHIFRVRARIPKDRHLERLLQRAGFVIASRERVMVCGELQLSEGRVPAGLYRAQKEDTWRLRQLHRQVIPPILSPIEQLPRAGHVVPLCSTFPSPSWQREYVWRDNGAALAHFRLSKGLKGSWINIVAMPACRDRIQPYLRHVLSQAAQFPDQAAYAPVPDYATDLARPLGALGFEPLTCQTMMIANIAKRIRVGDDVFVRGLQPQADI